MIQSSDEGTDLETKRNILLRQEENKMYKEGEKLWGQWEHIVVICEGQE